MKRKSVHKEDNIELKFVNRITSLFPSRIVKVILFGSRAKGTAKPGSYYDFLIILQVKEQRTIDGLYDVVTDFLIEYGVDISLKIYKEEEFRKMISIPTPFIEDILKTEKELWAKRQES